MRHGRRAPCLALWVSWLLAGAAGAQPPSGAAELPPFPELPPPRATLAEGGQGRIPFASSSPFDFDVLIGGLDAARSTTALGELTLPEDAEASGGLAAMVVVHGSGGIRAGREREYAALLNEHGYAALVLDYYTPRGATEDVPYLLRVSSVTEFDALTDAYRALALLRTHPAIDPRRIGIMGFSYGGMVARFALDDRVRAALLGDAPGFAVHVDFYGPCFQDLGTPKATGGSLLTLRGTEDASNDLEACARRERELAGLGVRVTSHLYPGAAHAWEVEVPRELGDYPYVAGCEMRYDARGVPSVDGVAVIDVEPGATRAERFAARRSSGRALGACVRAGYVVGRDDATRERANADLLRFLDAELRAAR